MSVVLSLLRAIDRADGEALVMHVGEKPYVVTATGHAELAAKPLTIPAMTGMLDQLLPADSRQALDELGAVEYHLPPQPGSAADVRYSVVAARGGDDIWIEVRRRKVEPEVQEIPAAPAPAAIAVAVAEPETYTLETSGPIAVDEPAPNATVEIEPEPTHEAAAIEPEPEREPEREPEPEPEREPEREAEPEPERELLIARREVAAEEPPVYTFEHTPEVSVDQPHAVSFEAAAAGDEQPDYAVFDQPYLVTDEDADVVTKDEAEVVASVESEADTHAEAAVVTDEQPEAIAFEQPAAVALHEAQVAALEEPDAVHVGAEAGPIAEPVMSEPEPVGTEAAVVPVDVEHPAAAPEQPVLQAIEIESEEEPEDQAEAEPEPMVPHHLAPVVPMAARSSIRFEPSTVAPHQSRAEGLPRGEGLPHLLQVAAAHGASVLYVAVQARPSLRVDGEIRVLEHETPLSEALLEAGLKTILPNGAGPAAGQVETCDVPGVGRVQCLSFRDHRGLGAMFKMLPARAISSEQMGLGAPIQALCTETEGLVLVAGARGAGKSTLVAALVDQMNRTRRDHVITVEQQIQFVHENRQSFVSQREARDDEAFAEAVKSALREGPDVLVVDHVASAQSAEFALQAAASGLLVIASITAATTPAALSRFLEFFGEGRAQARLTLSEHLRGLITQSLLRKSGGGRAAAREVLVNVPSVSALIADGHIDQLAAVLNGGRRVGMVPLNDALLALVQSGSLDVREAYRKSPDQQELVGQLNRAGLDTTFAERLA